MKTRIKTKIALLVLVAGLSFSCKKADTVPADATYDSTAVAVDSTAIDTTNVPQDTTTVITDTTAVPKQ
ncbi:hypothetical protein [Flavobacterium hibisci]|uniref:hypothetical protein n=1 Tax=Flavobacterium hibisci TaxID=1914462 RepID=UPI001CBD0F5B|nr:hypothetical protein [Flavobacterium hibisci]MBZ4041054.1 hypothetical protein [Flavobacterium hibisci]